MANKTEDNDILTGTLREFIIRVSTRFLRVPRLENIDTKYHRLFVGSQVSLSAGKGIAANPEHNYPANLT
jgi:hypothetical protein